MKLAYLGIFAAVLAGCASGQLPYNPAEMSPEQLTAMAKDRSAVAGCTVGHGPWGRVQTVMLQIDRGAVDVGAVTVTNECQLTFQVVPKEKAP